MALQTLKESTISAAKCRLCSPPLSPTRGSPAAYSTYQPSFRPPRNLASLEGQIAFQDSQNVFPPPRLKPHSNSNKAAVASTAKNVRAKIARPRTTSMPPAAASSILLVDNKIVGLVGSTNTSPTGLRIQTKDNAVEDDKVVKVIAPNYSYKDYVPKATIVYTRHEEEANDIVETMKGPVGFDLEWRVIFRKGNGNKERPAAVVQISDRNIIMIIQVSAMKRFPQKVKELIENPSIPKIGANIRNDGVKLLRDYGIVAANLVELGSLAREADPEFSSKRSIVGLATMIEKYCDGKVLQKGPVRISNWEAVPLTRQQLDYAANDAHSALMAYRRILSIAAIHERTLDNTKFSSSLSEDNTASTSPKIAEPSKEQPPATESPEPSKPPPSTASTPKTVADTVLSSLIGRSAPLPSNVQSAYRLWHHRNMPLDEICAKLRTPQNPLARSTVISYIVRALREQPSMAFSVAKLKSLAQLDRGSWVRHRDWILQQETKSQTST